MRKLFKGGNTVNEYWTKNCQNAPAMCGRVVMFPCSQINEFQSPPHLLNYSCPHCCEWTFPHHDCANFWSLEAEREGEHTVILEFFNIKEYALFNFDFLSF